MSYTKKEVQSGLKKVLVCGLFGLGAYSGLTAYQDDKVLKPVEKGTGEFVAVPESTKGKLALALSVMSFIAGSAVARKGKADQDMERDAKIVDGVVKSSRQNDVEMEVYAPNQGKDGVHKLSAFELAQMRNAGNTK